MILFLDRGMYGGVSVVGHKFARANIPGTKYYNPDEPESTMLCSDVNNLYGEL